MSSSEGSTLLLPIANPDIVDRILDTALDIALEQSMQVTAFHVVRVPDQLPLSAGDQIVSSEIPHLLEYAADRAKEAGIEIRTEVRFSRDTASGIVGSVEAYGGDVLLMGWRGRPRRRDIVLGSFLDRVLGEAKCDVFVKRIKLPTPEIASILVPVCGGPHDELASELAGTLASRHEAEILLFHVAAPDLDEASFQPSETLLEERQDKIPSHVTVNAEIRESDHIAGAITDETVNHDLTILGATREPVLRRKLVGSVAQGVGRSAASSVIVTRKYVTEAEEN